MAAQRVLGRSQLCILSATLDEFFGRSRELAPTPDLTPDEQRLMDAYRAASDEGKDGIMKVAEVVSGATYAIVNMEDKGDD